MNGKIFQTWLAFLRVAVFGSSLLFNNYVRGIFASLFFLSYWIEGILEPLGRKFDFTERNGGYYFTNRTIAIIDTVIVIVFWFLFYVTAPRP